MWIDKQTYFACNVGGFKKRIRCTYVIKVWPSSNFSYLLHNCDYITDLTHTWPLTCPAWTAQVIQCLGLSPPALQTPDCPRGRPPCCLDWSSIATPYSLDAWTRLKVEERCPGKLGREMRKGGKWRTARNSKIREETFWNALILIIRFIPAKKFELLTKQ